MVGHTHDRHTEICRYTFLPRAQQQTISKKFELDKCISHCILQIAHKPTHTHTDIRAMTLHVICFDQIYTWLIMMIMSKMYTTHEHEQIDEENQPLFRSMLSSMFRDCLPISAAESSNSNSSSSSIFHSLRNREMGKKKNKENGEEKQID